MEFAILAVCLLIAADLQNVLSWWRGWTISASWLAPVAERSTDFTIIVPVYGHPRYFSERARLARYKKHVLVSLGIGGPHEGDLLAFARELEEEGWHVHRVRATRPTPPELLLSALESGSVTTTYVVRMDADTYPLEDLGKYIYRMDAAEADVCSVKVEIVRPQRVVERLQALEYRMAMLARHVRPWLTSGACFVARRDALTTILRHHSLWFPGEDIETGRIGHALGMRVRHLDFRVATDAPATWRELYRQRRLWWAGGFRHIVVNADKNAWHMPGWTVYYLGLVTAGVIWKAGHLVQASAGPSLARTFIVLFLLYVFVTVAANWQVRSLWMAVYPPYAFAQALAMPTIGAASFFALAIRQRTLGRYRFGYRRWSQSRARPVVQLHRLGSPYEVSFLRGLGITLPAETCPGGRGSRQRAALKAGSSRPRRPTRIASPGARTAAVAPSASATTPHRVYTTPPRSASAAAISPATRSVKPTSLPRSRGSAWVTSSAEAATYETFQPRPSRYREADMPGMEATQASIAVERAMIASPPMSEPRLPTRSTSSPTTRTSPNIPTMWRLMTVKTSDCAWWWPTTM
jgi:hypothetical protein